MIQSDLKSEPDFKPMAVVWMTNQILQLYHLYFHNSVSPLLSSSPTLQREVNLKFTDFVNGIEGKANALLQRYIDS